MVDRLRKRKSLEHTEQVKFVSWVRVFYPELICAAIPNGADVSISQRIKLTQEGLLAGFPDVLIIGKDLPLLAIEFKRPDGKGKVSQEQLQVQQQMEVCGVTVRVVKSSQEAKDALVEWLGGKQAVMLPTAKG